MATGLPIITTDCGWVPKLVGREGGLVVPLTDADALAQAMKDLSRDVALRRKMGSINRSHAVANHTWDVSAQQLVRLYERLLSGKPSGNTA